MGRVYDALRRAGSTESGVSSQRQLSESQFRGEGRNPRSLPSAKQIEEQLFSVSSILTGAEDAVRSSAFTAHTANAPEGTALPLGNGSRAAGATLNAANRGLPTANSFVRCVQEFYKPASESKCVVS